MKKIFMASLVAMMAVTTANAQIASTEYTDATFVAKEGFDALVAATPQVTANKEDIKVIKEGAVVQVGVNQANIEAINNSDVMQSGVKAATVTQVGTNKTDIAALQVGKVDKNQTATNKNKAMVTDDNGDVVPGLIIGDMISGNAVKLDHLNSEVKVVLGDGVNAMQAIEGMNSEATGDGTVVKSVVQTKGKVAVGLGYIGTDDITDGAITTKKLGTDVKAVLGNGETAMQRIGQMNSENTGAGPVVKSVTQTEGKVTVGLGYIGTDDITDGAVTTEKIKDRAVAGTKIADSGVGTSNIADDAIVTSKILDANVTTAKIADANVTTAKIADANVTKAKLDASVQATLDKADNAMQEAGLMALPSWADQKCGDTNVTCSLVSKSGVIAWEAVKY